MQLRHAVSSARPGLYRLVTRQCIRATAVALVLAVLLLFTPASLDLYSFAAVVLAACALDVGSPLALRNLFLLYSVGLFLYGNHLIYPRGPSLARDLLLYLLAFITAYALFTKLLRSRSTPAATHRQRLTASLTSRLETLLYVVLALQLVRLVVLIAPYGLTSFYRGQELTSRISAYGQAGSTGLRALSSILVTVVVSSVVAVYVEHCLAAGKRVKYTLLVVVVVIPPLLTLERASLVYGSVLVTATYVCERRLSGSYREGRRHRIALRQILVVVMALLFAAVVAVKVGELRARRINEQLVGGQRIDSLEQVLRSEFTTIVFYRDVKNNIDLLGYQYGKPIVTAFATRLVPRSIWPGKPITSTEYFARKLRPEQLREGFVLAPSVFGVAFLNFGLIGTMAVVAILGLLAACCDRGYVERDRNRVAVYLIAVTWFYSVMRDDLSTSLTSVMLSLVLYLVLRRWLTPAKRLDE